MMWFGEGLTFKPFLALGGWRFLVNKLSRVVVSCVMVHTICAACLLEPGMHTLQKSAWWWFQLPGLWIPGFAWWSHAKLECWFYQIANMPNPHWFTSRWTQKRIFYLWMPRTFEGKASIIWAWPSIRRILHALSHHLNRRCGYTPARQLDWHHQSAFGHCQGQLHPIHINCNATHCKEKKTVSSPEVA